MYYVLEKAVISGEMKLAQQAAAPQSDLPRLLVFGELAVALEAVGQVAAHGAAGGLGRAVADRRPFLCSSPGKIPGRRRNTFARWTGCVVFAFFAACVCYRDGLHIAVMTLMDANPPPARRALGCLADAGMAVINTLMLVWGTELVKITWNRVIAEFPIVSVGLTYLPVPVGGAITLLFIIERLWTGTVFPKPAEWRRAVPPAA